jgi:hypothetical protein
VVEAGPWLVDSTRSWLQDLVVHGAGASIFGSATPGDVALALGSSSLSINWWWVEDEAKSVGS